MTPEQLVTGMSKLVSLPHVCIRVNLMVDDPGCSAEDIGRVILQDASLTARLLKIANSAFYGFRSRVDTVSRAVTLIGNHGLSDLVLAVSAVRTFDDIPIGLANMASFWRHNIYCGIVSRLLATQCNVLHTERLFISGLLHDIGQLIIFHRLPSMATEILEKVDVTKSSLCAVEQERLGFDHGDVGAELLSFWQLPITLQNTIQFHHKPGEAGATQFEAAIVHIADHITHIAEEGESAAEREQNIEPLAWEITGLSKDMIESIIEEAHPLLFEGLALIAPTESQYQN